ncbi:MAG: ABC transporter ATP-binding protein [Fibrobacterota bacterium]
MNPLSSDRAFLFHYLRPYTLRLATAVAAVFVSVVFSAWPVKVVERLVDELRAGRFTSDLVLHSILVILAVTLGAALLLYWQRQAITGASRDMEYHVRKDFLDYLHTQPASFYLKNRTGDIMSRASNDLGQVREMIGAGILHTLRTFFHIVVILFLMFRVSVPYTLIALAPVLLLPVLSLSLLRRMGALYGVAQERLADINSVVQESYAGIAEVKAYRREAWRAGLFLDANNKYYTTHMSLARMSGFIWPLFGFVASLSTLAILYFGGHAVMRGDLTIGNLVALNLFVLMLAWPLIALGWVANMIQRGTASLRRIRNFLAQPVEEEQGGNAPFTPGDIRVTRLTYTYPAAARPSLKNVSLEIREGRVVALAGTVGSGKTTLVNLLTRTFEPPAGTVLLNGRDIMEYDLKGLRQGLAVVPQETILFSDTVRNNILFGWEADPAALEKALEISRFGKDLAQIPGGLDQMLGERGINLSGGQKQRVAIARAVIRRPGLILLDDCLSAVDALTEAEILKEFETFFRGRTILIVSHRISVVRNADYIYVMDEGEIREEGTHAELMQRNGLYVRLYEKQRLTEEEA